MDDKKLNPDNNEELEETPNEKLEGLELNVNKLGEITSSLDLDKINKFLDENVEDKKLTGDDKEEE